MAVELVLLSALVLVVLVATAFFQVLLQQVVAVVQAFLQLAAVLLVVVVAVVKAVVQLLVVLAQQIKVSQVVAVALAHHSAVAVVAVLDK